eukprot:m.1348121 g.1348121  ORF g.1348121 m.1348121 type:complete len:57 (-) comp24914_c0_seq5:1830-2000(-)
MILELQHGGGSSTGRNTPLLREALNVVGIINSIAKNNIAHILNIIASCRCDRGEQT